jgi:hypothetical protein
VILPSTLDQDGDGLLDREEVRTHRTDPLRTDTDSDGLGDGEEILAHRTDPLDEDTDGDGFPDGREVAAKTNPLEPDAGSSSGIPVLPPFAVVVLLGASLAALAREALRRRP